MMDMQTTGRFLLSFAIASALLTAAWALAWLLGKRHWFAVWVKRPFQILAFAVALWIFFHFAELENLKSYAIALIIAALLGGLIHVIVDFAFTVFFSRQRAIDLPPLLRNVIIVSIYLIILVIALKAAVPGFSLSPLLVASGVLSLVIGLAFQDVLSNLIAGVTLSVEKPLRRDDWIEIDKQEGKVVDITWRTTKILTRQNDYVIFPNRIVAEKALRNIHYPSRAHLQLIEIGLPYSTLPTIAEQILLEAAERVTGVLQKPRPAVRMRKYDEYSILYWLTFWLDDYDRLWEINSDVHREIFYSLQRHGVSVPFPTRLTKHMSQEPPPEEWMRGYQHRLQVVSGARKGEFFPLAEEPIEIGRGEECAIDLRDPTASKQHARIVLEEDHYVIEDAGSRHGTIVNGVQVERATLRSGDEIQVGDSTLRFERIVLS